jgi:hypothetical protein
VPQRYIEGEFNLGTWVAKQRAKKTKYLLNAGGGWLRSDLFGMQSRGHRRSTNPPTSSHQLDLQFFAAG